MDERSANLALNNPNLSSHELQQIAIEHPNLWPRILSHPNIYPELAAWINAQSAPPARRGKNLWVFTAIVVILAVILGAGGWWFLSDRSTVTKSTRVANVPTKATRVDVSAAGSQLQLAPLSPRTYLNYRGSYLVGVRDAGSAEVVVSAVDMQSELPTPTWGVSVPAESVEQGCDVSSAILVCGMGEETVEVDLTDIDWGEAEAPEPVDAHPENVEDDKVSWEADGGTLVDEEGSVVAEDVPDGKYWAEPVEDTDWWAVSDGQTLIGVKDGKEQWREELAPGTGELTGFETDDGPHWLMSEDVLVVGGTEGIWAWDITAGEALWDVAILVDSWGSSDEALIVLHEGDLTVLPYPDRAEEHAGTIEINESSVAENTASWIEREEAAPWQLITTGAYGVEYLWGWLAQGGGDGITEVQFETGTVTQQLWPELGEILWLGQDFFTDTAGNVYPMPSEGPASSSVPKPVNDKYELAGPVRQMYETHRTMCEEWLYDPSFKCPPSTIITVLYQDGQIERIPFGAAKDDSPARAMIGPADPILHMTEDFDRFVGLTENGDAYALGNHAPMSQVDFAGESLAHACPLADQFAALTSNGEILYQTGAGEPTRLEPPASDSPVQQLVCASAVADGSRMPALMPRLLALLEDGRVLTYDLEESDGWQTVQGADGIIYVSPAGFITEGGQVLSIENHYWQGVSIKAAAEIS